MKFGIFVCVLAVLIIQEAASFDGPALLDGNCKPEDLPASALAACQSIKCNKSPTGGISFSKNTCALARCANGKELGHGKPDLTKKFPACCPQEKCD